MNMYTYEYHFIHKKIKTYVYFSRNSEQPSEIPCGPEINMVTRMLHPIYLSVVSEMNFAEKKRVKTSVVKFYDQPKATKCLFAACFSGNMDNNCWCGCCMYYCCWYLGACNYIVQVYNLLI